MSKKSILKILLANARAIRACGEAMKFDKQKDKDETVALIDEPLPPEDCAALADAIETLQQAYFQGGCTSA